jgi:adenylosuccinate lyase
MNPRYSRPDMVAIWSNENKYQIWFEIEALALEALSESNLVSKKTVRNFREQGKFSIERIDEIEMLVKHDMIAFLTNVTENVGEDAYFMHQGMTSSDVYDTCFAVQLVRASDLIIEDLDQLLAVLKRRAFEYKMTPTIGRSHGVHAEPTTFGVKLAQSFAEFSRCKTRMKLARDEISTCAISGAVGNYAHIDPHVEKFVAERLGLRPETISSQVIPRDRHAMFFVTIGVVASCVERLSTEIRHLQRTEVLEVEEFFSEGQKGSSAMPHKRNPILTENLTGLARIIRSAVTPALENVALWHERDISHSSVERAIGPDATITLDFALYRLSNVIDELIVYPEQMQRNLDLKQGIIYSQNVLLELTRTGLSREESYRLVQRNTMKVWEANGQLKLQDLLKKDKEINSLLDDGKIDQLFDNKSYFRHVDHIFSRVFD